ncbi:AraC family transcriptional regulator [Flavobacterium sp. MDT1-60]|uniref:helix-turn-helix domain-containing protein n=1 Tax=Flavobacterium sp. MDT1-60 TaxID=1979344 RepID=UPI0021020ADA|nr:helix-turn-helix domain-containing protein [Flavobacterium sp. MDT1-60]
MSDLLRSITGLNAQQYIQNHSIEKSKQLLAASNLNANEIACSLGFEYPHSFSKLFKKENQLNSPSIQKVF